MSNLYRGFRICDDPDGRVYIERDGALIGYAHDHEDAVMKVDSLVAPVPAPTKVRKIGMSHNGWTNPDADKPCGPEDPTLKTFDPIHVGGCKGCRAVVVGMLRHERRSKRPRRKSSSWRCSRGRRCRVANRPSVRRWIDGIRSGASAAMRESVTVPHVRHAEACPDDRGGVS